MRLEFRTSLTKTRIISKLPTGLLELQVLAYFEATKERCFPAFLPAWSTVRGIRGHVHKFKRLQPEFTSVALKSTWNLVFTAPLFSQGELKNLLSEVIKARRDEKHAEEKMRWSSENFPRVPCTLT